MNYFQTIDLQTEKKETRKVAYFLSCMSFHVILIYFSLHMPRIKIGSSVFNILDIVVLRKRGL